MQVFNNVPAYAVWKNYSQSVARMRDSITRLATGSRIATAGDDPAGLAMSERMRMQIRNSAMGAQNIQNSLAYLRTQDSWMQKIQNQLGRMSELAIAANDGTKTDADRQNLQAEFEQLQQGIRQITTGELALGKFNTANLFDGASPYVQVGPDPGQLFKLAGFSLQGNSNVALGQTSSSWSLNGNDVTGNTPVQVTWSSILARGSATTGSGGINVSTQAQAQRAGAFTNLAIDFISKQRAIIGAQASRLNNTLDGLRTYEENIRAAESQIRDVDVAWEATQLAKFQMLVQVGTAMLAQANALPRHVLNLIAA